MSAGLRFCFAFFGRRQPFCLRQTDAFSHHGSSLQKRRKRRIPAGTQQGSGQCYAAPHSGDNQPAKTFSHRPNKERGQSAANIGEGVEKPGYEGHSAIRRKRRGRRLSSMKFTPCIQPFSSVMNATGTAGTAKRTV